jgi:threonine/homoserine/homoserine lactone efflux protein
VNPDLWLAFAAASLVMALIPGPGVASIVGFALSSGQRTALASVAGMAVGNATAMTISLAGAGAILASSALGFTILKWLGAASGRAAGYSCWQESPRRHCASNCRSKARIRASAVI